MIELKEYTDFTSDNCQMLTEDEGTGKKTYKIRGSFSKAGVLNKNKRVYPAEVMKKAVEDVQPLIKEGKLISELEHPTTAKINLERIAAKITQLQMEDDGTVLGEMTVLDTDAGKVIKKLMDEGVYLGVSTRGSGDCKKTKMKVKNESGLEEEALVDLVSNYKLIAIDIVGNPSAGIYGSPDFVSEDVQNTEKGKTVLSIFKEMFN